MDPLFVGIVAIFLLVYGALFRRALPAVLSPTQSFPSGAWRWPEGLHALSIAVFFLAMAIPSFQGPPGRIDLKALQTAVALYASIILFVLGFLVFRNNDLYALFGLRWQDWKAGLARTATGFVLVLPPIYAAQLVAYHFASPSTEPQPVVIFLLGHPGFTDRLWVVLVAVVAAPLAEELVFRGCVYGFLRQKAGRLVALVVSAVLFALIHGHVPSIPGLLILSTGLVFLYEATGSLWAPIILHSAFNALSIYGTLQWPDIIK